MHNLYYSPMINVVSTAQSNPAAIIMISKHAFSIIFLRHIPEYGAVAKCAEYILKRLREAILKRSFDPIRVLGPGFESSTYGCRPAVRNPVPPASWAKIRFLRQLLIIPSPQFSADPDYFSNNSDTVDFFTR